MQATETAAASTSRTRRTNTIVKDWIEAAFGKHRPFLSLWLAVGSLFALSMFIGQFATKKRTALDGIAWLGTTFGLPQGYADWIASRQTWLSEHQVATSNILGVLLGLGIFALIIYGGSSTVKPSGPAGATVFVVWGITQEVGVTDGWWVGAIVLPIFLLLMWWGNKDEIKCDDLKDFGERALLALVELAAVVIALPTMLFGIFYTLSLRERQG